MTDNILKLLDTLLYNLITFSWKQHTLKLLTIQILLVSLAAFSPYHASAENIIPVRSDARILDNGQLAVSTRFHTALPDPLQNALKQGVALDFSLSYQLEKPTLTSYRNRLNRWINNDHIVRYRLSFHPLTNRYRISVGTFSAEYADLDTALKSIGAISDWQILHQGALSGTEPKDIKARIRLNLSTSNLPKPFQINAITAGKWHLDSGWKELNVEN